MCSRPVTESPHRARAAPTPPCVRTPTIEVKSSQSDILLFYVASISESPDSRHGERPRSIVFEKVTVTLHAIATRVVEFSSVRGKFLPGPVSETIGCETPPQMADEVSVLVPEGVAAGDSVTFQTPGGLSLTAVVPEGVVEGETFIVRVAPAWLDEILQSLTLDRFVQILDGFIESNCDSFMLAGGGSGAFTLEQTYIHQKYQRFFESRIEGYLKKHGLGQDAFMDALLVSSGERNALLDSLLVVQDFARFAQMMQQRAMEKDME